MTLKTFWVYDAATALPKPGVSLSWDSFINAKTGDTGASRPAFVELGGGEFGADVSPDFCGYVLTGAGQTPEAIFIESDTVATFGATGEDGLPLAGLTPTWYGGSAFDASGSPIAPAITSLSRGAYRALALPVGGTGLVDFGDGVGADPRFLGVGFGLTVAPPVPSPLPPPAPSTTTAPSTNQGIPYVSDWQTRLRSRLYKQFKGLPNITAISDMIAGEAQELEDAAQQVLAYLTNIDDATGSQLLVLGGLVGQRFTGEDEATYRRRVRARVKANKSSGTPDQLLGVFYAMMGVSPPGHALVVPLNNAPAAMLFRSLEPLDLPSARVLFDLLVAAKMGGVRLVVETPIDDDTLTAGDDLDVTVGGAMGDDLDVTVGDLLASAVSS